MNTFCLEVATYDLSGFRIPDEFISFFGHAKAICVVEKLPNDSRVKRFIVDCNACSGILEIASVHELLVVSNFWQGKHGFPEIERFTDQLISSSAHEGAASGEVIDESFWVNLEEVKISLPRVRAESIDSYWYAATGERFEDVR